MTSSNDPGPPPSAQPTMPSARISDAGGEREHVKTRRTHRAAMAAARALRGAKAGLHESDAASEPPPGAPIEGTGGR